FIERVDPGSIASGDQADCRSEYQDANAPPFVCIRSPAIADGQQHKRAGHIENRGCEDCSIEPTRHGRDVPISVNHRIEPVDPPGKRDEHWEPDGKPEPGSSKKRAREHREEREANTVDHETAQLWNPQQGLNEYRCLPPKGGPTIQQTERSRRGQKQPRAKSSRGITGPPKTNEQPEKKESENMSQSMSIPEPADPQFAVRSDIVDWGRSRSAASYIRSSLKLRSWAPAPPSVPKIILQVLLCLGIFIGKLQSRRIVELHGVTRLERRG